MQEFVGVDVLTSDTYGVRTHKGQVWHLVDDPEAGAAVLGFPKFDTHFKPPTRRFEHGGKSLVDRYEALKEFATRHYKAKFEKEVQEALAAFYNAPVAAPQVTGNQQLFPGAPAAAPPQLTGNQLLGYGAPPQDSMYSALLQSVQQAAQVAVQQQMAGVMQQQMQMQQPLQQQPGGRPRKRRRVYKFDIPPFRAPHHSSVGTDTPTPHFYWG